MIYKFIETHDYKRRIMKKTAILIFTYFILSAFLFPVSGFTQPAFQVFNAKGGKADIQDILKATKGKTHIFFGELHNNPIAHWLQLELTKALHADHGEALIIGAEMFESDNQILIDEYFSDLIQQDQFEAECRLWDNYQTDYKPILEYAKAQGLRFVATNIPRRYANAVYHGGLPALKDFSETAHSFIAPLPISIDTTLITYQEINAMSKGHSGGYMLEAQAIKDATMAHFILLNSTPGGVFFHLNGSYHSSQREGIIAYLQKQIPAEQILTITTVEQDALDRLDPDNAELADFTICIDKDMTKTY